MNKAVIALMFAVVSLMAMGFVMLVSLYIAHSGGPHGHLLPANLIIWQILGAGFGLVLMGKVSRMDYRRWQPIATRFAGLVFMLLILALIPGMGPSYYGARRWLYLGPWGSFQPSILAGIALVLLMAWWYRDGKERPGYFFWIPLSVILLWSGLIFYGRDFTTAFLLLLTGGVMMIIGGEKAHYLLLYVFWVASGLAWLILRKPPADLAHYRYGHEAPGVSQPPLVHAGFSIRRLVRRWPWQGALWWLLPPGSRHGIHVGVHRGGTGDDRVVGAEWAICHHRRFRCLHRG